MRCFVALELPAAVRATLHAAAAPLRQLGDVRWVAESQLHLTLKFLGDCEPAVFAGVQAGLQALLLPPLQLSLQGFGSFPPRGAPRVVWAGLGGDVEEVRRLARELEQIAAQHGIAREHRPFTPHVTLGRARSPRQSLMLQRAIAGTELASAPFTELAVTLFASELTREGAKHTPLCRRACG